MYRIVYVSSASKYFARNDIESMLKLARVKNEKIGITGMLLYKDGNFLQALEGERDVVEKLSKTIQQDPRHSGFVMLMQGPVDARLFPDSPMGFHDLAEEPLSKKPGYLEFIDSPLTRATFALEPNRCLQLLNLFTS